MLQRPIEHRSVVPSDEVGNCTEDETTVVVEDEYRAISENTPVANWTMGGQGT